MSSQAGLAGMLGMAGSSNVQGEDQKKLDVLANDVFITLLRKSGQCAVLVRWIMIFCRGHAQATRDLLRGADT